MAEWTFIPAQPDLFMAGDKLIVAWKVHEGGVLVQPVTVDTQGITKAKPQ